MREIEGIDKVVTKLMPHMDSILQDWALDWEHFNTLMGQNHELIGRVLKCHLVVEYYIEKFLIHHFNTQNLDSANLSFFQKAKLLPDAGSPAAFVKPGVLKLNSLRNRFGHTLKPELSIEDLGAINDVLAIGRKGVEFSNAIDAIEAFTEIASAFLRVSRPEIQQLFNDAFAEIRINS